MEAIQSNHVAVISTNSYLSNQILYYITENEKIGNQVQTFSKQYTSSMHEYAELYPQTWQWQLETKYYSAPIEFRHINLKNEKERQKEHQCIMVVTMDPSLIHSETSTNDNLLSQLTDIKEEENATKLFIYCTANETSSNEKKTKEWCARNFYEYIVWRSNKDGELEIPQKNSKSSLLQSDENPIGEIMNGLQCTTWNYMDKKTLEVKDTGKPKEAKETKKELSNDEPQEDEHEDNQLEDDDEEFMKLLHEAKTFRQEVGTLSDEKRKERAGEIAMALYQTFIGKEE